MRQMAKAKLVLEHQCTIIWPPKLLCQNHLATTAECVHDTRDVGMF